MAYDERAETKIGGQYSAKSLRAIPSNLAAAAPPELSSKMQLQN